MAENVEKFLANSRVGRAQNSDEETWRDFETTHDTSMRPFLNGHEVNKCKRELEVHMHNYTRLFVFELYKVPSSLEDLNSKCTPLDDLRQIQPSKAEH